MYDSEPAVSTIANDGDSVTETQPRLILAVERIADALEQIARQPTSATEKTMIPPSGDLALGLEVASMNQHSQAPPSPVASVNVPVDRIANVEAQLAEVRDLLRKQQRLASAAERKFYAVDEVAELTGLKPWTIRQACNKGRVKASKGDDGRWRIPHDELVRLQEEGLPAE